MFPLLNDRKAGGGGTTINITGGTLYDTVAAVEAATIGGSVGSIQTAGYYAAGDGGGAIYKRVGSEPSHALKIQSADGAWWEIGEAEVNVLQAGATADGVANDLPAFVAIRDRASSGEAVHIRVPHIPGRSYVLSTAFTDNGRYVTVEKDAGAVITGTVFVTRYIDRLVPRTNEIVRGTPSGGYQTLGHVWDITNTSTTVGYGLRVNYTNTALPTTGFDLAAGFICNWKGNLTGNMQGQVIWQIYATPNNNTWTGGFVAQELNPVNRGPDMGWVHKPGAHVRWHGGIRFVPESQDPTGDGGTGRHVTFAYTLAFSGSNNADGVRTRTYTGYMVEPDAIAPGGMAAYFNGSTSGTTSEHAVAMLSGQDAFKYGVKLNNITFSTSNFAILIGNSHKIGWADSSNVVRLTIETGTATPEAAITANPGSIYVRTNGSVYKKASGTGNTGWVELLGSTFLTNSIPDAGLPAVRGRRGDCRRCRARQAGARHGQHAALVEHAVRDLRPCERDVVAGRGRGPEEGPVEAERRVAQRNEPGAKV